MSHSTDCGDFLQNLTNRFLGCKSVLLELRCLFPKPCLSEGDRWVGRKNGMMLPSVRVASSRMQNELHLDRSEKD